MGRFQIELYENIQTVKNEKYTVLFQQKLLSTLISTKKCIHVCPLLISMEEKCLKDVINVYWPKIAY